MPTQRIARAQQAYRGSRATDHMSAGGEPSKATLLTNVYPLAPGIGAGVLGRPGTTKLAFDGTPPSEVQWIGQFTQKDGTEITVLVGDGEIWTYDWTTDLRWEKQVTQADFVTAVVPLATTGRVYGDTFADQLVLTDGVNKPLTWDGTAGSVGLAEITDAPVAFGPPTVYYAKLFFINDANRIEIMWSEEGDPYTGYDQGGFNNAWELRQTNNDGLTRVYGTNRALYYWRANRIGSITGAVNADFVTTGVNDSVSDTIGTQSPESVVFHNGTFTFIDSEGRPQSFTEGRGVTLPPLWNDAELLTRNVPDTFLAQATGLYRPVEDVILIAWTPPSVEEPFPTDNEQTLAFTGLTGEFLGVWEGYTASRMGMVKNGLGQPRMIHADNATAGDVFLHAHPEEDVLNDDNGVSDTPIKHEVDSGWFMWDPVIEKNFTHGHVSFVGEQVMSGVEIRIITPYTISDPIVVDVLPTSVGFTWNATSWDSSIWGASTAGEAKRTVGFGDQATGRWALVRVTHETAGERFGLLGIVLQASVIGDHPETL